MIDLVFPSIQSVLSITAIGIVFALALSIAKKRLHVERDPRIEQILALLPGANCGACGMPGCAGYAMKIADCTAPVNLCPACGSDAVERIAGIMGVEAEKKAPLKARVHCQGGTQSAVNRFIYSGPKSCDAAQQIMGGFRVCEYGCLGLGDCEASCPFDAIHTDEVSSLPVVDIEKCTGCGNCVSACPRAVISLVDQRFDVYVMCLNREKGAFVKRGCSVGCIACNRCVKACKEVFAEKPEVGTAIEVTEFLAVIDYGKCINCGKCAEVCPQNVISYEKVLQKA